MTGVLRSRIVHPRYVVRSGLDTKHDGGEVEDLAQWYAVLRRPPATWTVVEVAAWAQQEEEHAGAALPWLAERIQEACIDGELLLQLTADQIRRVLLLGRSPSDLPLVQGAIAELQHLTWGIATGQVLVPQSTQPPTPPPPRTREVLLSGSVPKRRTRKLPWDREGVPRQPSTQQAQHASGAASAPGASLAGALQGGPQAQGNLAAAASTAGTARHWDQHRDESSHVRLSEREAILAAAQAAVRTAAATAAAAAAGQRQPGPQQSGGQQEVSAAAAAAEAIVPSPARCTNAERLRRQLLQLAETRRAADELQRLYQASFKRGVSPAARRNTASARASPSPRHRDATHSPARSDRVSQLANDYSVGDLTADLVGELSVGELSVAQLPAHHHRDQPSSPNRPDATIPLPQRRDQSVDAQTDGPSSPLGAANQVKAGLLASPARPAGAGGPRGAHGGRPQFLRALSPVLRKELEYPHGPYRHQAYPVAMPDVYQTRDMDRVRQVLAQGRSVRVHHTLKSQLCEDKVRCTHGLDPRIPDVEESKALRQDARTARQEVAVRLANGVPVSQALHQASLDQGPHIHATVQKRVTPTDAQRECAADSTAKLGRMPHMHATLRTQNTTHSRAASARPTDLMQTMARSPASIASPQPAGYPVTGAQRTLGFPHNATGGMHHDGAGVHTPKARGVRTRLSFHSEASPRRHSPGAVSAGVDMRRVSPRTDSPRVGGARSRSKETTTTSAKTHRPRSTRILGMVPPTTTTRRPRSAPGSSDLAPWYDMPHGESTLVARGPRPAWSIRQAVPYALSGYPATVAGGPLTKEQAETLAFRAASGPRGVHPVHLAAQSGHPLAHTLLHKEGVGSVTQAGETVVHRAARSQYPTGQILSHALSLGAKVNTQDAKGLSPLASLLSQAKWATHGPGCGTRDGPLRLQQLLASSADPNTRDAQGNTALHQALQSLYAIRRTNSGQAHTQSTVGQGTDVGLAGVLSALVQHGADVNARNNQGLTPLHILVSQLHRRCRGGGEMQESLKVLLRAGADPNITDNNGRSCLHVLLTDVVEAAALQTANKINHFQRATNQVVKKPRDLSWALRLLLSHQADVSQADPYATTPLHMAAAAGSLAYVHLMGEFNTQQALKASQHRDRSGRTPIDIAMACGHDDIIRILTPPQHSVSSIPCKDTVTRQAHTAANPQPTAAATAAQQVATHSAATSTPAASAQHAAAQNSTTQSPAKPDITPSGPPPTTHVTSLAAHEASAAARQASVSQGASSAKESTAVAANAASEPRAHADAAGTSAAEKPAVSKSAQTSAPAGQGGMAASQEAHSPAAAAQAGATQPVFTPSPTHSPITSPVSPTTATATAQHTAASQQPAAQQPGSTPAAAKPAAAAPAAGVSVGSPPRTGATAGPVTTAEGDRSGICSPKAAGVVSSAATSPVSEQLKNSVAGQAQSQPSTPVRAIGGLAHSEQSTPGTPTSTVSLASIALPASPPPASAASTPAGSAPPTPLHAGLPVAGAASPGGSSVASPTRAVGPASAASTPARRGASGVPRGGRAMLAQERLDALRAQRPDLLTTTDADSVGGGDVDMSSDDEMLASLAARHGHNISVGADSDGSDGTEAETLTFRR